MTMQNWKNSKSEIKTSKSKRKNLLCRRKDDEEGNG